MQQYNRNHHSSDEDEPDFGDTDECIVSQRTQEQKTERGTSRPHENTAQQYQQRSVTPTLDASHRKPMLSGSKSTSNLGKSGNKQSFTNMGKRSSGNSKNVSASKVSQYS